MRILWKKEEFFKCVRWSVDKHGETKISDKLNNQNN